MVHTSLSSPLHLLLLQLCDVPHPSRLLPQLCWCRFPRPLHPTHLWLPPFPRCTPPTCGCPRPLPVGGHRYILDGFPRTFAEAYSLFALRDDAGDLDAPDPESWADVPIAADPAVSPGSVIVLDGADDVLEARVRVAVMVSLAAPPPPRYHPRLCPSPPHAVTAPPPQRRSPPSHPSTHT
jgi:hypothetical protein